MGNMKIEVYTGNNKEPVELNFPLADAIRLFDEWVASTNPKIYYIEATIGNSSYQLSGEYVTVYRDGSLHSFEEKARFDRNEVIIVA